MVFLDVPGDNPFPGLLQPLEGASVSWLMAPILLQSHQHPIPISLSLSLTPARVIIPPRLLTLLPSSYKDAMSL